MYKKSFSCFFLYSSNVHITLHGFPAAITPDGISLFTKLHAPIILLSPIVTPNKMVVRHHMKQFFPTLMGPYITVSGFPSGRFLITRVAAS